MEQREADIYRPDRWKAATFSGPCEIGEHAQIGEGTTVHSACVEGTVGRNCRIWRWSHIWHGAVLGDNCMVAQGVMIGRAKIGNNVRIQNGAAIGHGAVIEDDVFIGPGVQFCNSVHPSALVDDELRPITVLSGASIGANCSILGGVTIGLGAVVGAGSVVTRDVPGGETVKGVPAR